MSLKLSYRDKVIFIVVMVILVLVAGFFLIIRPKFEAVETAKAQLEEVKAKQEELNAKIATLPALIEEMKKTAGEIKEKQALFLDEGHPYQNEVYIREALSGINLDYISIETTYTLASAIDWYSVTPDHILAYDNKIYADLYGELPQEVYDDYNKVEKEKKPGAILGVTKMMVTFEGGTNVVERLIDKLADDEHAVIINSISTNNESENGMEGLEAENAAELTLYSIYPLNVDKIMEETADIPPVAATTEPAETTAAE